MTRTDEFEELRPLLFAIAYRILSSVGEAEDAVQEAWLRWAATTTAVASPKAFLSATVTRIAIDVLRSARARRERYVGPWFPEPLLTDPYDDPERAAELADSVSMASLLLLEQLTPLERAAFVLRDVFGSDYSDVAAATGRSEAACRQLVARARRHMAAERPRFTADDGELDALAARFLDALREGEVDGLAQLLAADVHLVGDSGGNAPLWKGGITGAERVARAVGAAMSLLAGIGGTVEPQVVNRQPGLVFRDRDARVINVWSLEARDGRVQAIRALLNPDKLAHLGPVADPWATLHDATRSRRTARR